MIAFAILVPMMRGMSMAGMMDESDLPPGWSYSPSTYLQRLPIIALGAQPAGARDEHAGFDAPIRAAVASALRGVNLPWTLVVSAMLGAFLMFTRVFFGTVPPMADSDHLVGALIVTFAVIAMAEVGRPLRFVNVAFGLWLMIAPWLLDGAGAFASWIGLLIGLAVVLLSLPRGKRSGEHYGSWDRYVV